jgi:hypothetical protein
MPKSPSQSQIEGPPVGGYTICGEIINEASDNFTMRAI